MYAVVLALFPLIFLCASLPPARQYAARRLASYSYAGDEHASFTVRTRASCGDKTASVYFYCPGDPVILLPLCI